MKKLAIIALGLTAVSSAAVAQKASFFDVGAGYNEAVNHASAHSHANTYGKASYFDPAPVMDPSASLPVVAPVLAPIAGAAALATGMYVKGGYLRGLDPIAVDAQMGDVKDLHLEVSNGGYLGAGYDFGMFRADAEFLGSTSDHVTNLGGLVNGYVDVPLFTNLEGFLGAGVGYIQNSGENGRFANADNDGGVALRGQAGLGYSIMPGLAAELTYSYLTNSADDLADSFTDHLIGLGLRYGF